MHIRAYLHAYTNTCDKIGVGVVVAGAEVADGAGVAVGLVVNADVGGVWQIIKQLRPILSTSHVRQASANAVGRIIYLATSRGELIWYHRTKWRMARVTMYRIVCWRLD